MANLNVKIANMFSMNLSGYKMTNMPQVSTAVLLKAFYKLGFVERDRKNSHVKIVHPSDPSRYAAIPNHRGACVAPGTLRNILKSTRVEAEQLKELI